MPNTRLCRVILLLVATAGTAASVATAQIASLNPDTHSIINARSAGLADAYVSEPFDAMVMYWNPAGLTHLHMQSLILNGAQEVGDFGTPVYSENVTLPLPVTRDWGLGAGLTLTHAGGFTKGSAPGTLSFAIFKADLAVARSLDHALSAGAGVTMRYGQGGGEKVTTLSSTLGIYYTPYPAVSYGISMQGLGKGVGFGSTEGLTFISGSKMQESLQGGMTVRTSERDYSRFTLSASAQKVFGTGGIIYKGGIEAIPISFLALRLGYWIGPNSRAGRYGAGLILGDFLLDYTIAPSHFEPRAQQLSFSYNLQPRTVQR